MKMKSILKSLTISAAIAAASVSGLAGAKVTPAEAEKLKKELTPVGAERAGNADGSIPAWTGGLAQEQVPSGKRHGNKFKDDKVLFTIDARNYKQYQDKLSKGMVAMFEKYPDSFKMPVYPTRRSASYPQEVYDKTFKSAAQVSMTDDGKYGIVNPVGTGFPYPIPKVGAEVILNHVVRYRGNGLIYHANQAVVEPSGRYVLNVQYREIDFAYGKLGADPAEFGKTLIRAFQEKKAPPRVAGEKLLSLSSFNEADEKSKVWIYNPGQRRIRRAPEFAYDAPTADGLMTRDQTDGFAGALDRYNWKIIGKKELYIGYNGYIFQEEEAVLATDDVIRPGHINQDLTRYELHRVWVVEAKLKSDERHIYKKRVFYVDEDSWTIAQVDIYDNQGNLWRVQDSQIFNYYTVPYIATTVQSTYDLQSGRYAVEGLENNFPARDYTFSKPEKYFTPPQLRTKGVR